MRTKDGFVSLIKGVITGIASLVPTVSPASIVLSLNSYEKFTKGFADIFKKKRKVLMLSSIPIIFGILIGLLAGYKVVGYFYDKYKVQTILFFVGLIIGGINVLTRKNKTKLNVKISIVSILLLIGTILFYVLLKDSSFVLKDNFLGICILGIITGFSLVVPLISSGFLHMKGAYNYLFDLINNSSFMNVLLIIVFLIITILVVGLLSKLFFNLFKKYKDNMYIIVCTLLLANIVVLILQIDKFTFNFVNIFTSIIIFLWGYILGKNIEKE